MWELAGTKLESRLLLGTAQYPSLKILRESIVQSKAEIVTVALRRESAYGKSSGQYGQLIRELPVRVLPNTAGCRTSKEAILTARLARDLFKTNWIKLEVIGEEKMLQPDPFGTYEAAKILIEEGFEVFPYITEDLVLAERLLGLGVRLLMPWGSPIGSGRGLSNRQAMQALRNRFPTVPMIVDAGLGRPSHAVDVMELGFDAVLVNTAIAISQDPPNMAESFAQAVHAGRKGYEAGLMAPREFAVPSTPEIGIPFRDSTG